MWFLFLGLSLDLMSNSSLTLSCSFLFLYWCLNIILLRLVHLLSYSAWLNLFGILCAVSFIWLSLSLPSFLVCFQIVSLLNISSLLLTSSFIFLASSSMLSTFPASRWNSISMSWGHWSFISWFWDLHLAFHLFQYLCVQQVGSLDLFGRLVCLSHISCLSVLYLYMCVLVWHFFLLDSLICFCFILSFFFFFLFWRLGDEEIHKVQAGLRLYMQWRLYLNLPSLTSTCKCWDYKQVPAHLVEQPTLEGLVPLREENKLLYEF